MNRPKFFVGIHEIGDTTLRLSQGLRELGYEVTNVVIKPSTPIIPQEGHDRYIRTSNMVLYRHDLIKEFIKNSYSHDIFIFNFSTSFFSSFIPLKYVGILSYIDVLLLKAIGKKIVFISNGDDLRSRKLLIDEMKKEGLYSHARYMEDDLEDMIIVTGYDSIRNRRARIIEKYADYIFAKPDRAQFLTKPYNLIWPAIDLRTVKYRVLQSDEPLILHAPSSRLIKGTKYVLNAIKKLEKENYKFRFMLCENIRNEELKKKLFDSEIIIDQLLLPGYGLFSIEAMASGNAVLGSAVAGYNGFSDDLPIVTTTPDTIYENLKMVLEDPGLRVELAKKGRKYVEKYHELRKVTRDFLKKIEVE